MIRETVQKIREARDVVQDYVLADEYPIPPRVIPELLILLEAAEHYVDVLWLVNNFVDN